MFSYLKSLLPNSQYKPVHDMDIDDNHPKQQNCDVRYNCDTRSLRCILIEDYNFINKESANGKRFNSVLSSNRIRVTPEKKYTMPLKTFVETYTSVYTDDAGDDDKFSLFKNEYRYLSVIRQLFQNYKPNDSHASYSLSPKYKWILYDLQNSKLIFISTQASTYLDDRQYNELVLNRCRTILLNGSVKYILNSCVEHFKRSVLSDRHRCNDHEADLCIEFNNVINDARDGKIDSRLTLIVMFCKNEDSGPLPDDVVEIFNKDKISYQNITNHGDVKRYKIRGIMKRSPTAYIHKHVNLDLLYGSCILHALGHMLNIQTDSLYYGTELFKLPSGFMNYYYKLLFHRPIRPDRRIEFYT